uniref:acylneuraminate cytidylyltransferase family protein n=1 Tax=Polynucleobacter sp. TaxID=2029855 RepID=UPI004047CB41
MKVAAFIFARGGSKGLPKKNILRFGNKPLIAWSIEQALAIKEIEQVIVSTDCIEIADVARQYGAVVPFMRPADLAKDDSPEWFSWQHALNYLLESRGELPEAMVSLPATAPLRLSSDISNCIAEYKKGSADVVITITDAHRSPYFNMVKINDDGTLALIIPPHSHFMRRQDVPMVYDMTTVCYVLNPGFVMTHNSIFEGKVKAVHVPPERAIDIDTLVDFRIAESLLNFRG